MSQIKKAIVFPFNKEIHAIAKYESLINFEVVDYYDVRISGHVGNKISNINEFIDNEKVVKNITDLDWSGDFDTIICGHCGQLSKLLGKDLLEDIVQKCNKHRKLLYSFDSLSKYDYNFDQQSSCCFYSPVIEKQNVPLKNFGKLYISSKPVIGVYGTSSSQGKYSLQLQMRKILQENDYNVSQIGTEPSGYLFNMSFSYPIGYNSSVSISNYDAVLILNNELYTIEANGCDIIITGAQSASVPYEPRCVTNISFATNDLLMGTLPDIIILCVNFDDDTEYIKRTINYLESYTNSKVLGVVMYPFKLSNKNFINKTKVNNNELNNKIETLRNQIQKNVYKYEELNVLCENIIDYFSA